MLRLLRPLRSRRLAVWLLGALVGYAAVAAALDLREAFGAAPFVVLAALVAASTAACAWERSVRSLSMLRSGVVTQRQVDRLRERPSAVFPLAEGVPPDVSAAASALRSLGFRVTAGERMAEGRRHRWSALGSPVFHWSLALLIVVIALGQLTRAEGLIGIATGDTKPDVPEAYGVLQAGPLHGGQSGASITVERMEPDYTRNGIEYGPTPYVRVASATGALLAEGYVHTNAPLRYGSTVIHMSGYGLAAQVRLEVGDTSSTEEILLDYADDGSGRIIPRDLAVLDASGQPAVSMLVDADSSSRTPALRVRYAEGRGDPQAPGAIEVSVAEGESVTLPGGVRLTADRLTSYARLAVVDDWSVPFIYALFLTGVLGLAAAILAPPSAAWVLLVEGESGPAWHVVLTGWRTQAGATEGVRRALGAAAGASGGERS
ncbi:MAG: hypothetical protein Kow0067_06850 [Coriobacteriia bacterium]